MTKTKAAAPLVSPEEFEKIFLRVLTRVRELLTGEHQSIFTGTSGVDFASVREKQPDDPPKKIDWAKSTITGFNPLIIKEMVEDRSVEIVIVADASLSTRFGVNGVTVGHGIARAIAIIGFSAAIIQDPVAQFVFSRNKFRFEPFGVGKNHILNLLGFYQDPECLVGDLALSDLSELIAGELRRTSLIVFISDFISSEPVSICKRLVDLTASNDNDVVILMVDSSFAFDLPKVSSEWIGCRDAESGKQKMMSSRELKRLSQKVSDHQKEATLSIENMGLDVLRVRPDREQFYDDILHFFLDRKISDV